MIFQALDLVYRLIVVLLLSYTALALHQINNEQHQVTTTIKSWDAYLNGEEDTIVN